MPPSPVEDDLALFNEVQNIETESFLLQSKVNFDDILPKEYLSVSSIGERSDLLDAEGDKNDYDWLISPPETPLFRSLDDEAQPRVPISSQSPPKRGLSPSPCKPTPSPRRITSPSTIKIGRGNSSSPQKIKARKSNSVHGFSSEVSRNYATTSLSPTASSSVGSVASSGDDDLDSLRSFPVSQSAPKGVNFSRKPGKGLSRSAPKTSFDLVRQMDRKGPQHMFRPLLSGVPSSTFHAGDASLQHYSPAPINSLLTTRSSNASSDPATSGPHDTTERSIEQNALDTVMDICSKCGQIFSLVEVVIKGDPRYCCDCKVSDTNLALTNPVGILNSVKEQDDENGSYTVSSTSCDDVSYVSNTSVSVSSSVDFGVSIRQTEVRIYQKFSVSKLDTEDNSHERNFEEKTCWEPCEQSVASESMEADSTCTDIESVNVFSKTREEEETLHAKSEMSMNEEEQEVGTQSSCADMVDIAEVLSTVTLDAMSEIVIENADVISADSHSDVDSTESKRCMDEIHHVEEAITKSVGESDAPRLESRVLLDDMGENEKTESRSLTLEEATDAILFCSSIVHSLAYEASNTAINNETLSMEVLRPTSTFLGKPDSERNESTRKRRSNSKTQKSQEKTQVMDTKLLPCNADETDENPESPCIVRVPNDVDSSKPDPKLESKCNCTIM